MLTIGDVLAACAVQAAKPRVECVNPKACLAKLAERLDSAKGKTLLSRTQGGAFAAAPHADVRPALATGLSVRRSPQDVMRYPDALQGGAPCPRNGPHGGERSKAA